MAIIYYANPGIATAANNEPPNGPLDPPFFPVSFAAYLTELISLAQASPDLEVSYDLVLKFSRSSNRTNPGLLTDAVLDTGKTYAIFVPDVIDFAYSNVDFKLDGVLVQTETSAPWDYAGTAFGGTANVTTVPAGLHTIDAIVTYPGGTLTISSSFEVN